MADLPEKPEDDQNFDGFVVEDLPGGGIRIRPKLDAESLNISLKNHCENMEDYPLLASLFSLNIVVHYLKNNGIDPTVLEPLYSLSEALDDLNSGIKNPLLEIPLTEEGNARPPGKRYTTRFGFDMALASAAITLSGRGYMKETTRKAAMRIRVLEKTLSNFRRNVSTGKIKDPWVTQMYRTHVESGSTLTAEEKRSFSEEILNNMLGSSVLRR